MSSLLLYASLILVFFATILLIAPVGLATRPRALAVWVLGAGLVLGTWFWPPPATRTARGKRLIDAVLPRYQFTERHRTKICAKPEKIAAAVRQVAPDEIRWLGLLSSIRGLRAADTVEDKSLLEVAQEANFVLLADTPAELLLGTAGEFWQLYAPPASDDPVRQKLQAVRGDVPGFAAFDPGAGAPKAVVNFVIEPADFGCQAVTTETRISAANPEMQSRFASYWRLIQPGSALLRRSWLDAVRARAEGVTR